MWKKKEYPAICHVCGKEHTVVSEFVSFSMSRQMPDGTMRGIVSCGDHDKYEIREAYAKLMKVGR
jgi:hypothetical protein